LVYALSYFQSLQFYKLLHMLLLAEAAR